MIRPLVIAALVLLVAARPAAAQGLEDYDYENLELRAIGLVFGGVAPTRAEGALTLGLQADFGFLGPYVRMMPSITYWSSSLRQREVDRLASQILEICIRQQGSGCPVLDFGTIRLSDLAFNVDAHYVMPNAKVVEPYAGAGLGLHFLNGRGAFIDGTFVEDFLDTLSPGLNFIVGAGTRAVAPLTFFAEARYSMTPDVRFGTVAIGGLWTLPVPVRAPARTVPLPASPR